MKPEKIPGWNPELEGKLAGQRERAARQKMGVSPRSYAIQQQRDHEDWTGRRVDRFGGKPIKDENPELLPELQKAGKDIAEDFVLQVKK